MLTKRCTVCNEEKNLLDFIKSSGKCKDCRNLSQRERRNRDPLVQWAKENKSSEKLAREKFVNGRKLQPM